MYCVTVRFTVKPEHNAEFLERVTRQARDTLAREIACRQFDVWTSPDAPDTVFLYEIYDDRAAFDAHLAADHFLAFDAAVAPWVTAKTVETWEVKA